MCSWPSKTQTCVLCFEIFQRSTKFQKSKNDNKPNKPTTIPYCNNFTNKNQFSNNASTLLAHYLFIICTLVFCWHEILAHNTFMACNLAFSLACMFLQVVKCRHQKFSPTFDLITHFVMNHNQFPITPYHLPQPMAISQPTFLGNLIEFPFPLPMFFL